MTADSSDRLVGTLLDGRYRIESRIARGGMAKVYRAIDTRLEREVAIKIMHDHLNEDGGYAQRFIREARHTARLAHPNIVSVFDQGFFDDTLYLVMEYLPGMTLRDLLKDYGTLTVDQALDITTAVLNGLAVAHREGILHRDIKPENVMLVNDGRIKVGDFGLARPVNNATDTGQTLLGTVAYIAPELLTRTAADSRSDLYSVGIMLYEMLTGTQPFVGETPMAIAVQHAQAPMPLASATNPDVPRAVDDVIQWATQKNPADRPRDAKGMLDALRSAAHSEATETAATRVLDPARLPSSIEDTLETRHDIPTISPRAGSAATTQLPLPPVKRKRGFLWGTIVALIVLIGGGVAALWYINGPGSLATGVSVEGMSVEQATATLTAAGIVVSGTKDEAYSATVPQGNVITTNPTLTGTVAKGTVVHLVISLGPEPIALPDYSQTSSTDYSAALSALGIAVSDTITAFSKTVADGNVIGVQLADGTMIAVGDTVRHGDTVVVVESAGRIPKVIGLTSQAATANLSAIGLDVLVSDSQEFSSTIPAGSVIRLETPPDPVYPGDQVTLILSKGPELVTIPSVDGLTIDAAKKLLENLGFTVTVVTDIPEKLWSQTWAKAATTSPATDETAPKGSTVTLTGFDQPH